MIARPGTGVVQAMAEGGALSGLKSDLDAIAATYTSASAPLMAGASATLPLDTSAAPANTRLSVVAMMLPTNDGFIGLDAVDIPSAAGTYIYSLNAYDASTEANDELITGGGAPGVAGADSNTNVHVHRGAIGDDNPTGGNSDLDNTVHRWLNPVARITVVMK